MRIHCTKQLLDKFKRSEIVDQDTHRLDENYKDSPQADQLYDWHANFITLGMYDEWFVIMVNDLTGLPVVIGPFTQDNFHQLEDVFRYTLAVLMRKQGLPKGLVEDYLTGTDGLVFTKTLGPKKLGLLNAVKRDLNSVFNRPFVSNINPIETSEWISSHLRAKENDYYRPSEEWLEEWEHRTNSPS